MSRKKVIPGVPAGGKPSEITISTEPQQVAGQEAAVVIAGLQALVAELEAKNDAAASEAAGVIGGLQAKLTSLESEIDALLGYAEPELVVVERRAFAVVTAVRHDNRHYAEGDPIELMEQEHSALWAAGLVARAWDD